MKVKVSEAKGQVLDWMVATCEGYTNLRKNPHRFDDSLIMTPPNKNYGPVFFHNYLFSSDWGLGGPIIEREQIDIMSQNRSTRRGWIASIYSPWYHGPTPLIAAMRCYVTSKLGDEVDVPEVLCEEP